MSNRGDNRGERLELLGPEPQPGQQQQQVLRWRTKALSGRAGEEKVVELLPGSFSLLSPLVAKGRAEVAVQLMVVSHLGLPMAVPAGLQRALEEQVQVLLCAEGAAGQAGRGAAGARRRHLCTVSTVHSRVEHGCMSVSTGQGRK